MAKERLQKIISSFGICSRRKAEKLILNGRVKVDGKIIKKLGFKADPNINIIEVNGKLLKNKPKNVLFLFYKPRNVLTTLYDDRNRLTIKEYTKHIPYRLFPVGRLDFDAEGLLLLTNDGEFANKIIHPSNKISKVYKIKINNFLTQDKINKLFNGIRYKNINYSPIDDLKIIKKNEKTSWIIIKIHEGKYHEIKNIFLSLNHRVLRLIRISIGPFNINGLKPGELKKINAYKNILNL